jgi:uncharacterized membrane protein YeaQ/YmgE (transglycosylase-associated protein family)
MAPAIPLALLMTGLLATGFHLIWGQRDSELALYWLSGVVGFALAQWLLGDVALPVPAVGTLALAPDMVGALCAILVANALKL